MFKADETEGLRDRLVVDVRFRVTTFENIATI